MKTDEELAKIAGTSEDTIYKSHIIKESGSEALKDAARSGKVSISAAKTIAENLPKKEQDEVVKKGKKETQQVAKKIKEGQKLDEAKAPEKVGQGVFKKGYDWEASCGEMGGVFPTLDEARGAFASTCKFCKRTRAGCWVPPLVEDALKPRGLEPLALGWNIDLNPHLVPTIRGWVKDENGKEEHIEIRCRGKFGDLSAGSVHYSTKKNVRDDDIPFLTTLEGEDRNNDTLFIREGVITKLTNAEKANRADGAKFVAMTLCDEIPPYKMYVKTEDEGRKKIRARCSECKKEKANRKNCWKEGGNGYAPVPDRSTPGVSNGAVVEGSPACSDAAKSNACTGGHREHKDQR